MKRSLFIYSGIGIAMFAGWYFLLFIPLQSEAAKVRLRSEKANQELIEFQRIMIQLPTYLETYSDLEKVRLDLNDGLYARDKILELFTVLINTAEKRNLKVVEISPPVEELLLLNSILPGSDQPPFLNLIVTLEGSYLDFGKYVESIESAQFYRGINRCLITTATNENASATCTISFQALLGSTETKS